MRKLSNTTKPATGIHRSLYLCAALSMAGFGVGCGANMATAPAIHRAGPAGGHNLSTLTPAELAFGNRTHDRSIDSNADLSAYLKPNLPQPTVVAAATAAQQAEPKREAAPEVAAKTAPKPAVEEVAIAEMASVAPIELAALNTSQAPLSTDAERYAEREAQSQNQQEYRGGDVLVISASTIVIVLLIALLVLLLT